VRSAQLDVVILTWNDGALLDAALRSALGSVDVEVHVIVVDNGSRPPAVIPSDPRVRLVQNAENLGVAPARNQGIRAGESPLVCLLDSDATLTPMALRRLIDILDAEPAVALVGPVFVGQPPEASAGPAPTLRVKLERLLNLRSTYATVGPRGPAWDVDFCIGACQVLRRAAWEAVGGLDESYFYGPEDVDFCLRLREAGWRIMQVRADVQHPPRRRFRGLATRRGMQHAWGVGRHLWRHRRFQSRVASR
jgi:N-acetylglucosaminyl-diphospho-decaprenol L-rhamnosyltransferase